MVRFTLGQVSLWNCHCFMLNSIFFVLPFFYLKGFVHSRWQGTQVLFTPALLSFEQTQLTVRGIGREYTHTY